MTKGNHVVINEGCHIGNNVILGDDVYIDYNCIIRDNVVVGSHTTIGPNCILGEYTADWYNNHNMKTEQLNIGEHAIIRSGSVLYAGAKIGKFLNTGHHVTIREKTVIGDHCSVGTLTDIQGKCSIGNYARLHSNVFVGPNTVIKDYVWVFPHVVITNDPTPPSECALGATIENYAVISAGSTVLPGVKIETDSLVAAGALVTKNVEKYTVVGGVPAKKIADIDKIQNKKNGEKAYPWRYSFDRYMPWEGVGFVNWEKNEIK